jgi:hypothetical protein
MVFGVQTGPPWLLQLEHCRVGLNGLQQVACDILFQQFLLAFFWTGLQVKYGSRFVRLLFFPFISIVAGFYAEASHLMHARLAEEDINPNASEFVLSLVFEGGANEDSS